MPTQAAPNYRVMKIPAVVTATALSKATIYRWMEQGTFPKPIQLGTRGVGRIQAEIDGWIEARVQARSAGAYLGASSQ